MIGTVTNNSSPDKSGSSTAVVAFPPIFNLHQDILLHIFYLNTFEPESEHRIRNPAPSPSSALNVTRYSSQTCRVWRHNILESPAIWGRIIDTTALNAGSEEWSEEVMKRTGDCLLSVYGRVGYSQRSRRFLETVLVRNWHRVRRLDVTMDRPHLLKTHLWETLLQEKAPLLETFIIDGVGGRVVVINEGGEKITPVFRSASVPSLRRFHCNFIEINRTAMWISQLSSVSLSYPFTLTDLFTILPTTIRLESLSIAYLDLPEVGVELHGFGTKIHLPHLRLLNMQITPTDSLTILRKVRGHMDCALSVKITEHSGDKLTSEKMEELTCFVATYARRFFDLHKPPKLLMIFGTLPFFIDSRAPTDMKYFAHPVFIALFQIMSDSAANEHNATTRAASLTKIFLSALASLPLGSVTELEFSKEPYFRVTPVIGLLKFLEALTSVRKLKITQDAFDILTNDYLATASTVVFPLLQTVRLEHSEPLTTSSSGFVTSLVRFLSRRAAVGRPVLTLELSPNVHTPKNIDWGFLDVFEGLNVVWTSLHSDSEKVRYVCGSGEKARLDWSVHLNQRTGN